MSRYRLYIFLLTIVVVGFFATLFAFYARGYRFNSKDYKLDANGLLVLKSNPDSAQIYLNGELKTATNATLPLPPGAYDVTVRKDGFIEWKKRLNIQKEIVTESSANLFKSAPSLTALTFESVETPTPSHDYTKLAYIVPGNSANTASSGLWVIENLNLPLGFAREPKRITDGSLTGSSFVWSNDDSQILLTTAKGTFLLDATVFTSQAQRTNVAGLKDNYLADWQELELKERDAKVGKVPDELKDILTRKSSAVVFSPDEDMILYTASSSATLQNNLIRELPGASTQKQEREIKPNNTYVYDIKEDRNFIIDEHSANLQIAGGFSDGFVRRLMWYPSSRNLILAEKDSVIIMDYDGTNRQKVYSGSYVSPNVFPTLSLDRLLILTNFGATNSPSNLYSLTIK
jgi:hypothetical protein